MGHTINEPIITLTRPGTPTPVVLDITDDCASATFGPTRASVSRPMFGSKGQNRAIKGLWDGSLDIDFNHDYNADKITQFFWDCLAGDDLVEVALRAKDAEISTGNPEWRFQVSVESLSPVDGGAGELATGSITLPMHGEPVKVTTPGS